MTKNINVCFYMRYSSAAQNDGFSIEAQREALQKYADENGFFVVKEYVDRAKTGTNDKRPAFQQMIKDSSENVFKMVLVHKLDRFARNQSVLYNYSNLLEKNGVALYSITERFANTPSGKLLKSIMGGMSEFYSGNLGEEVKKGLNILASRGLHTGGTPPLGYDVDKDRKLVINENEAVIVRLIFDLYATNHTYNYIANELNLRNYKTKCGKEFTGASLYSILNNRKYLGEYVYNLRSGKDPFGKYNSHRQKPEEEVVRIPNNHPRIIDDATFEKVAHKMELNKHKLSIAKPNSNYLLSGLVKCGKCGFNYQGNSRVAGRGGKSVYSSYRCGKKQNHKGGCDNGEIEKNKLETFVLEQLKKYLFNDDSIKKISELVNAYNIECANTKNTDLIRYEEELKEVEKEIKNLTSAIAKGVSEDIFVDKINDLYKTKVELNERIDSLVTKELPQVNEADIKKAISKFPEYVKNNDTIMVKTFLRQYIEQITVYEDKVDVDFKVASNVFNANFPEDETGKVLIDLEISRDELNKMPKQKRKTPSNVDFGKDYLKKYEVVTK